MDQPKEDAVVAGIGSEISPPSAKKVKRCIQSKLSWHKPRVMEVEEEKEKCEEVEGEGKKKGKSRAKTPKKDSKSPQSKLPWYNPQVEEAKAVVIEEEKEESQKNEDDGEKKGRKRKSQPRTPQKSPAKSKEARRTSGRNKNNTNSQQLKDEQTGDDTPTTSPTSRGPDHVGSSSKKRSNNRRSDGNKDVDGQNTNICRPLTDLWLEAKKAAEENLRLSAGKQTHPFFTSRKTAKRLPETREIKKMEARCWPGLDGDYMVSCPPVHVFDTSEDDIASFDWKNWVLTETALSDSSGCHVIEKNSSVFDGSVKPLILGNLHQEGMHLNQLSESVEGQPLSTASVKFASVDGEQLDTARLRSNVSLSPCHARCVDSLENKQQDRLLTERLMSYYQRISCWPECSLWTNKYQPENTLEVCGNSESVRFLSEWLKLWNERVEQNSTNKVTLEHCVAEESEDSAYGIESDMDDEATLKNVLLITGPVGSGKSAAIYACAKEHGFEVIEVNTSDVRNGAHMKQEFGQAVDSHSLNKWSIEDPNGHRRKHNFDLLSSPADVGEDDEFGSSVEMASRSCKQDATQAKNSCNTSEEFTISQTANKTLILFEDVDTVFDEDRGFIASILQLAETAKRPIILTSNYRKPVLPQLLHRFVLDFTLPSSEELLSHVHMICASEKACGSSDMLERLVSSCLGDIRKALMLLQFWCQGKELQTDRSIQCSYSLLPFDIDAAYLAVPRLIPWELPCKLSEKVGEEVDKTIVMVEENVRRMEAMPQVLSSMEMINLPKQNNVATPAKPRKRALFKSNPSFLDCTEFLDTANGLEDSSDGSGCPGTNARRTVKSRPGIVLSSQSDDGSADERPCTSTFNAYQMPDMSSTPFLHTAELLNLLELPIDPTCGYERQDIAQQPLGNFETTSVSHICDTFTFQDVSCVPESYFISGTESNREDNFFVLSSHNTSFNLGDSIGPIHVPPGDPNNTEKAIIEQSKCLEDRNICDEDGESVDGNEEHGDSKIIDESQSCRYQLMDECSRADFSMRLLSGKTSECSLEVDLVQETWRKLRHDCDDLKSYLSANRKDASLIVNRVSGLADLISEADILLKSCYPLINDTLEPSMVPCVEPDICSCYEEQMEMGSTYAQHGLCFYTNKLAEIGSSMGHAGTLDLAQEMLASSVSTMALGKLISKGKTIGQNSQLEGSMHKEKPRCGIPTGREMEPELYDAILSTVPTRLSMVLRDSAFHEYVSFLSKLSRLECSRLSESTERKRRSRVSRHYLSSGAHSLSDERVQLLAQSGCFKSRH